MLAILRPLVAEQPPKQDKQPPAKGKGKQKAYQPTADEKKQLLAKLEELNGLIIALKAKSGEENERVADVEIHAKAVQRLMEFPEEILAQADVGKALTVLDRGLERGKQLRDGMSPWVTDKGRRVLGYYSGLDGSVQPYILSVPPTYDGTRSVPLYVWLHGRNNNLTEASFIHGFAGSAPKGNMAAGDLGQAAGRGVWPGEQCLPLGGRSRCL